MYVISPFVDYMWLHIRAVGEWTNRLYDYFEKEQEKLHNLNEELPVGANSSLITTTPNGTVKIAAEDEDIKRLKALVIFHIYPSEVWKSECVN